MNFLANPIFFKRENETFKIFMAALFVRSPKCDQPDVQMS